MRWAAAYVAIGCLIAGIAAGRLFNECPMAPLKLDEMALVVVVWPALAVASYVADDGLMDAHQRACP